MQTSQLLTVVLSGLALAACQTVPERVPRGDGEVAIVEEGETEADEASPYESGKPPKGDEAEPNPDKFRTYERWPRRASTQPRELFPDRPGLATTPPPPPIIYGEEIDGPAPQHIRVGTFNLRGFGPNKARYGANPRDVAATHSGRTITAFIVNYVLEMQLDVVAFQEVVGADQGGLAKLQQAMGAAGYAIAVGHGDDEIRTIGIRNNERCPIFYRLTSMRHEVDEKDRPIRGTVDIARINLRQRRATYAYLGVREDRVPADKVSQRFRFIMTCQHAPPPGRPPEELQEYWEKMPKAFRQLPDVDTDVILAGDLNTDPRTTSAAERQRFAPVLSAPPQGAGFIGTHGFSNARTGSGTTVRGGKVYDDLLWREPTEQDYAKVKVIEYGFAEMFRTADGEVDKPAQERFSDHYPVWALFHTAEDTQ